MHSIAVMENALIKESENPTPPAKQAFHTKQLSLFQDFLCNSPDERLSLSNTIELWDAVPKYYITKRSQEDLRKNGFLPTVERKFVFRKNEMIVTLRPARLTVDGKDKEFYPSAREELVEDVLRKLACGVGNGYLDGNRSGVSFTLHQLRKELSEQGHTFSYYQVVESLKILRRTSVQISSPDGNSFYETSPLTMLTAVTREDLNNNPESRWYVDFSALVTEGIQRIKYRQYNYGLMMRLKGQLTRYLHKRLSHNFTQASLLSPYTITLSSVARDSGLLDCKKANDNKRKLEESLGELIKEKILMRYETEVFRGSRNAIVDAKYDLFPDHDFISETKRSNKRLSMVEG